MEDSLDRQGGPPPTRVLGPDVPRDAARRAARPRPPLPREPLPREPLPRSVAELPTLPIEFQVALDRGLRWLGITLGADTLATIDAHVRLLLAWNAAFNLTAITDPALVATRHVVDSLTALPLLRGARRLLDLGSGGGFPGLPLAAAVPDSRVTLVEAVAKKARFLDAAVEATGLGARVEVRASRGESLRPEGWDVVLARGVGGLGDLIELAMPLLEPGGRLLAWKREPIADELEAARRAAAALGGDIPLVQSAGPAAEPAELAGHVLVEVRKAAPTPPGYPRDPGRRRRRPW